MSYVSVIHADPAAAYPALMGFIAARLAMEEARHWCEQLRTDESDAEGGAHADVAADLTRAQADFAAETTRLNPGSSTYPYNATMGAFLGLPLNAAHEPTHGYYMAGRVRSHYLAGVARRQIEAMIAEGRVLRVPVARDKKTRAPVRFAKFAGPEQIRVVGGEVIATDGKRRITLRSNWSHETALAAVADAMSTGRYYGEKAAPAAVAEA